MSQITHEVDAVVVGAGFSGIYMTHKLNEQGLNVQAFEAASGVGGTWYWNRYPGARCDVISMEYAYTFNQEIMDEWEWSERYPAQPEILRYLNFAADKLDVKKDFTFNTRVDSATFDEGSERWLVSTDAGHRVSAKYLISAVGCLSTSSVPDFTGLESFQGDTYHTGEWPHGGVDFTGKRVGVIGTGSSGVQVIPLVAEQADHLTVFQRTPPYSLDAGNRPLTHEEKQSFMDGFEDFKLESLASGSGQPVDTLEHSALEHSDEQRVAVYEERWGRHRAIDILSAYPDLVTNSDANKTIADFFRSKIRAAVDDPELAEQLSPMDYPLGAKRMTLDTGYFQTYNRDNVTLVSVKEDPIEGLTENGVKTGSEEYPLDAIVFATGFDAITGPLLNINITGREGVTLQEKWEDGPETYLGISVDGFPNLFMLTGPGSPNVLTNVVCAIEQHVEWTADCISYLEQKGARTIEATDEASEEWTTANNEMAQHTLYVQGNSWYTGANIPGKPQVIMSYVGGLNTYRSICDETAEKDYAGFAIH